MKSWAAEPGLSVKIVKAKKMKRVLDTFDPISAYRLR